MIFAYCRDIWLFRGTLFVIKQKWIITVYLPYPSKKLKIKPTTIASLCRINMPPVDSYSFSFRPSRMCLGSQGAKAAPLTHMCFSVLWDTQHFLEKPRCDDLTFHMSDDATSTVLHSKNHPTPQSLIHKKIWKFIMPYVYENTVDWQPISLDHKSAFNFFVV